MKGVGGRALDQRMAGSTVVTKEWRNDTKEHCAATDASIRQANKLREEAEWLIGERKSVTERAQKDVKFRLTEKVTDTQRCVDLKIQPKKADKNIAINFLHWLLKDNSWGWMDG